MSTNQKCSACIKESVCKFTQGYQQDCKKVLKSCQNSTTQIMVKCKEYVAKSQVNTRRGGND